MDVLREAAEAAIRAWDGWRGGSAPLPSRQLDDAMERQRGALRVTDGWQLLPASAPNLTVEEYVAQYFGGGAA